MAISMEGLTATQARQAGLTGLVMGITVPGYIGSVGDFETGHKYNLKNPEKLNSIGVGTPLDGFNGGENIDTTPKNTGTGERLTRNPFIMSERQYQCGYYTILQSQGIKRLIHTPCILRLKISKHCIKLR